jgi:uncharacterized membrane protein YkoI
MFTVIRKSAAAVAALGALGLGGAAIAGAAGSGSSSGTSATATSTSQTQAQRPQRQALSSDAAAKVKAAALAKVPGATVRSTEAGGPYGTPYHAHITTSGGTRQVVLVNASFEATTVQAEQARGARGGPGHRGGGETALTGETKEKVEAAVRAKYSGATILRTETNGDSTAPYESHVETSDGKELEVLVSKGFEVVDAREHPARP